MGNKLKLTLALGVVAASGVAFAQAPPPGAVVAADAEGDPATYDPGFATLDRQTATSTFMGQASYLFYDTGTGGGSLTPIRLDLYGSYVDPRSRFGGYAQLPVSILHASDNGRSDTYTGIGDLEVGAIYAPRLSTSGMGLILHGGLTLPTGSSGQNEELTNLLESFARLTDFYQAVPGGLSMRLGISGLWRSGTVFVRVDGGLDVNLDSSGTRRADTVIKVNGALGFDTGGATIGLELVNLYDSRSFSGNSFGSNWIDTGALSARFRSGGAEPYVAVVFPLDHDSYQPFGGLGLKWNAALTVGVAAKIQ